MTADGARRTAVLLLVALVVAGASLADRLVGRPAVPVGPHRPATAVISGSRASSSAWYCAAGAAAPAGTQASVVVTNPISRAVAGTLSTVTAGAAGSPHTRFTVPAGGQLSLPLPTGAAARLLLRGGGVGAFEVASGPLGWSAAPCVSTTASNWYFAHGSTVPGRAWRLSLFNPTPSDAVVDVTFVSAANGVVVPPAYQGVPVPAGGLVVEDVSDHVQRDPAFATEVSALSGTVVAAAASEAGGPGPSGLALLNGVAAPERRWAFAEDTDQSGGGNTFSILNPSSRVATVTVSIALTQGRAAPITIPVPPSSVLSLAAQDQTRIPQNAVFAVAFVSSGPGIVVSREAFAATGASASLGDAAGAPGGESRWLVPAIGPPAAGSWAFGVVNLGHRLTHVTVGSLGPAGRLVPLPGEDRTALAGGGLLVLGPDPGPPVGRLPLEVLADGPVAVELDPQPTSAPGTVVLPAWPLVGPAG